MTTTSSRFKILPLFQALALLSFIPHAYASQNFLIQPNGPLPSGVTAGSTITANFTITNLTNSARNGYNVAGFPSTVTQNASGGNCSAPINLAAHASCNLQLIISGAVNSNFAICRGNSCTTSSTPLNVSVINFLGRLLAGGTYCSNSSCLPLLAQSTTGEWSYPSTVISNLPTTPGFGDATIYTASCSGQLCIVAGYDNDNVSTPFIAVSPSNANNWTYPVGSTGTWPSDLGDNAQFESASCSGSLCVVAGQYFSTGKQYPIVAQSINSGVTWTYPISSSTPPPDLFIASALNGASCSGNLCVVAGTYEDNANANFYALLEQTTNGGTSWSIAIDRFTGPTLHNYNDDAEFTSASCSGALCIAGGQYYNGSNNFAILAQTTNGGGTWTYAIDDIHGPSPALFEENSIFNSTSCSGNLCVAGGTYTDTGINERAMLVQSRDGGTTWTYVIDALTGPQPANYSAAAAFASVSCSGNVCAAAGQYTDTSSHEVPLLAQTIDGGLTWTYMIQDSNPPPNYTSLGQFYTVTCLNNSCIAAGTYTSSGVQYPVLAQSISGGTWMYAINSITSLPTNFANNGVFYGSSIGSNTLFQQVTQKKSKWSLFRSYLQSKASRNHGKP